MDNEKLNKKVEDVKQKLLNIDREGMNELVEYMNKKGFFTAPASTKFHGAFKSGLFVHSYYLFDQFKKHCNAYKLDFSEDSMMICAFGHDLCKAGSYLDNGFGGYKWNPNNGTGHAKLSLERIKRFIELTPEEETIIRLHMGPYGTTEFGGARGEYSLKEMTNEYNNNKLAKLFYFCDDMSSQFLEK